MSFKIEFQLSYDQYLKHKDDLPFSCVPGQEDTINYTYTYNLGTISEATTAHLKAVKEVVGKNTLIVADQLDKYIPKLMEQILLVMEIKQIILDKNNGDKNNGDKNNG